MKVPKIFIPERDLNKVVESLKSDESGKSREINDLEDFILRGDMFVIISQGSVQYPVQHYPFILKDDVINDIHIEYEQSSRVEVLEFKTKRLLEDNIDNVIACVNHFNNIPEMSLKACALVKDAYATFVYAKDSQRMGKIIDVYKKKFHLKKL